MTSGPRDRWLATVGVFGPAEHAAIDVFTELATRHAEPGRHYHTLEHVQEVLDWVDTLEHHATDPTAVRLAAWVHDVVYDPRSSGNEAASAAWGRGVLPPLGVPDSIVDEVTRLVDLTDGHRTAPGDANGAVLADADLAILGAERTRYERYVRDVRREYGWLAEDDWRSGRRAVLADLAGRVTLFRTDTARSLLDRRARANLAWELGGLDSSGTAPEPRGA